MKIFALVLLALLSEATRASPLGLKCTGCELAAFTLKQLLAKNGTETAVFSLLSKTCVALDFYAEPVCSGLARKFEPEIRSLVVDYNVQPKAICYHLGLCQSPPGSYGSPVKLPPAPPTMPPKQPWKPVRFIHFTDLHYDPLYSEGASATCDGFPICCRNDTGGDGPPARHWGEYTCDPPFRLIESIVQQASIMFPDAGVVWTGDNRAADIWAYTKENIKSTTQQVSDLLRKYFTQGAILPSIGNHDTAPIDSFWSSASAQPYSWLTSALWNFWQGWIPQDQMSVFLRNGYWSGLIQPGLRVVSMYSNWADKYNFYTIINVTDPGGQLVWLVDTLYAAEKAGESVILIGHIPMMVVSELESHYARQYKPIADRFNATIIAQLFGHTHKAQFSLSLQANGTSASSVQLVSGSLTPRGNKNPQFRLLSFANGRLDGFKQYVVRLNNTFDGSAPKVEFEYDPTEAYGLPDVSANAYLGFARRLATDDALFNLYYRHLFGDPPEDLLEPCDSKCKSEKVCNAMFDLPEAYKACLA